MGNSVSIIDRHKIACDLARANLDLNSQNDGRRPACLVPRPQISGLNVFQGDYLIFLFWIDKGIESRIQFEADVANSQTPRGCTN